MWKVAAVLGSIALGWWGHRYVTNNIDIGKTVKNPDGSESYRYPWWG